MIESILFWQESLSLSAKLGDSVTASQNQLQASMPSQLESVPLDKGFICAFSITKSMKYIYIAGKISFLSMSVL